MTDEEPSPINELQEFLDEIEALAPTRQETEGRRVSYRPVSAEEIVDDSLPLDDVPFDDYDTSEAGWAEYEAGDTEIHDFQLAHGAPIVAIDCGIARLGETENGLVIALRAAIIKIQNGQSEISLFRTGPMYLHNLHKLELLYQMGRHLGKLDHFVEVDETDPANPRPRRVKSGVAHDSQKYADRFRNWFERLTQRIAATKIENGTVLLDGALTLRTIDTPDIFLENLATSCSQRGNALIAVSKQSLLQVQGRPLRFWLDDAPNRPCYRCLTPLMRREESERVLGNAYAARFSALGPTFRMDVMAVDGQTDGEAINRFFSSAMMRGGYPDILVRAHTHSYFTSPDVIQLQAQAGARYRLVPRGEVDLSGIFGPFGGRFK
jgi:hypothetical protein